MAIVSIWQQPAATSINSAYRPIRFTVRANNSTSGIIPPVVYCDIYVNGTYYKSIERTIYVATHPTDDDDNGIGSDWVFDIQDAVQEVLASTLPPNGTPGFFYGLKNTAIVYCMFRSSGNDSSGFIVPDGPVPVQGTGTTAPTPGGGTSSTTFYVVNTVLQHMQNMDLASHLNAYKTGSWLDTAFPLTHRPQRYKIGLFDSDHYPILYKGGNILLLRLWYQNKGQTTYNSLTTNYTLTTLTNICLLIPAGPKNLATLFGLDWININSYYLQLIDDSNQVICTTCTYLLDYIAERVRVRFLSYCGTYDGVNFMKPKISHEDSSSSFKRGLSYPLVKTNTGSERFDIRSNDTYQLLLKCTEADMPWLQELSDSPKIFLEVPGIEGQDDSYMPMIKVDGKFEALKNDRDFDYSYSIELKLSNEYLTIRN